MQNLVTKAYSQVSDNDLMRQALEAFLSSNSPQLNAIMMELEARCYAATDGKRLRPKLIGFLTGIKTAEVIDTMSEFSRTVGAEKMVADLMGKRAERARKG